MRVKMLPFAQVACQWEMERGKKSRGRYKVIVCAPFVPSYTKLQALRQARDQYTSYNEVHRALNSSSFVCG